MPQSPRVAKKLSPMPQSPTDIFRRCLSLLLPTEYICRYFIESSEIFTVHATITDCRSVGDYRCKYRRNYFVGKVLARNFVWRASLSVRPSVFDFFLFSIELATEKEITNDQYSDGRIRSVKILPTNCVSYTNGMNLSVKSFNGVV
jgi:hypothetical protein